MSFSRQQQQGLGGPGLEVNKKLRKTGRGGGGVTDYFDRER